MRHFVTRSELRILGHRFQVINPKRHIHQGFLLLIDCQLFRTKRKEHLSDRWLCVWWFIRSLSV